MGSYYRPPSASINSLEQLNESIYKVKETCKDKIIILGGDFNLPHIDWESSSVKLGCNQSNQHHYLLDIMEEHGLEQMQTSLTRENHNLDLYFTSHPSLVKACQTVSGISHHDIIVIDSDIKPKYNRVRRRKVYNYKKADWNDVSAKMEKLTTEVCKCSSTEESWKTLKMGINSVLDSSIPSKLTSKNHGYPWISGRLKRKIRKKHKLHQKAKQTNLKSDWEKYRILKRTAQKECRNAHWKYVNESLSNCLEEGKNKSFWKYIKSKRNDSVGVSALRKNGQLHQDSKSKADILNDQFKSVFTKQDHLEETPKLNEPRYPKIDDLHISIEGVEKLLHNLDPNKASGPDNIPNKILKLCAKELAPAITHIFNQSLNTGILPVDWKNANISPIFKKGNKHDPSNYRPVSLTSVCCKTLEHIICRHILSHLEHHKILTPLQHGFRSGHSCESQLIITMNDILSMYDQRKQIDMVILDFSKAFDTIPHNKLLLKLENYGIHGEIHRWITSFLTGRH